MPVKAIAMAGGAKEVGLVWPHGAKEVGLVWLPLQQMQKCKNARMPLQHMQKCKNARMPDAKTQTKPRVASMMLYPW